MDQDAKEDIRQRILQVAGKHFAGKGYRATTIRAICQDANVNLAAVNYYFGDKERLYIDAVKHARSAIEARWPLPPWDPSLSPRGKLTLFLGTLLRRLLRPGPEEWRMRLVLREVLEPTRACEEMVEEAFRPFFEQLLLVLREILPTDVSADQLRRIGWSVIGQCVFYRSHKRIVEMVLDESERAEAFDPDVIADHIVKLTLPGLEQWNVNLDEVSRAESCADEARE